MSSQVNLAGWLFHYDDSVLRSTTEWIGDGKEIRGQRKQPDNQNNEYQEPAANVVPRGTFQEHWLKYHAPIDQDAEIHYEFYYEPGRIEVHPAIGRMAMILRPDGVRLHWITDAQWDRTGLAPDNMTATEHAHELRLKPDDWNQVTVRLVGDSVTLLVNAETVFERELEPSIRREFGLFHFADQTEARARNLVWNVLESGNERR
jgi:hypothetical protein